MIAALPMLFAALIAAPLEPEEGETIAVLPLRSTLEGADAQAIDSAALADRVRAAARLALPDALVLSRADQAALIKSECTAGDCELAAGREAGADLIVSGEVARSGPRYRASLELRDAESGKLLGTSSASGAAGELF